MRAQFTRIGKFVEARPGTILLVTIVLACLAVAGASQTHIVTTQDVFVNSDSETALNNTAYKQAFGGDSLVLMIPGKPADLTSPKTMAAVAAFTDKMTHDSDVKSVVSALTLLSAGTLPQGVTLDQPGVITSIVYAADGTPNASFTKFFPSGHELIQITLKAGLTIDEQGVFTKRVQDAVTALGLPVDSVVAGYPRLTSEIASGIERDMAVTGLLTIVLMIVVLYVVFPVRRRLMALPVVLVGVLLTFGVTGAAGVNLTLVTMAGLPVLMGLGMDFAVQFHNRYEEELARGDSAAAGLIDALTHIGPAVGAAVLATILGFVTLSLSAVPAVRDFGLLLALGVAILFVVALFALNSMLYRFDKPKAIEATVAAGASAPVPEHKPRLDIGRYLAAVSAKAVRFGPVVVAVATVLAVAGFGVDHLVPVQTDIEKLVPADAPGLVAMNQVRDVTGSSTTVDFLIGAPDVTAPAVLAWTADFQAREMKAHPQLLGVTSLAATMKLQPAAAVPSAQLVAGTVAKIPAPILSTLVSDDHRWASLTFALAPMSTSDIADLITAIRAEAATPAGVTIVPTGTMNLAASVVSSMTGNRLEIAVAGFVAVFVGLLVIYRSWRRALAPVFPIVLVTGWSSGVMWLMGMELNPLTAVMSALIVGVGTEFAVLLLERFWEELGRGAAPRDAMAQAVTRIGRAVAASGLTVTAGFAALMASSFPVLREFGAVTVIDVLLALVATIVVVPPLALWLVRRGRPATVGSEAASIATA
jgi:hypothetical protein